MRRGQSAPAARHTSRARQPFHVGENGNCEGNDLRFCWFDAGKKLLRLLDGQVIDRRSLDEAQWAQEFNALATKGEWIQGPQGSLDDRAGDRVEAVQLLYPRSGLQNPGFINSL